MIPRCKHCGNYVRFHWFAENHGEEIHVLDLDSWEDGPQECPDGSGNRAESV